MSRRQTMPSTRKGYARFLTSYRRHCERSMSRGSLPREQLETLDELAVQVLLLGRNLQREWPHWKPFTPDDALLWAVELRCTVRRELASKPKGGDDS